jgi:hypothetical protein
MIDWQVANSKITNPQILSVVSPLTVNPQIFMIPTSNIAKKGKPTLSQTVLNKSLSKQSRKASFLKEFI